MRDKTLVTTQPSVFPPGGDGHAGRRVVGVQHVDEVVTRLAEQGIGCEAEQSAVGEAVHLRRKVRENGGLGRRTTGKHLDDAGLLGDEDAPVGRERDCRREIEACPYGAIRESRWRRRGEGTRLRTQRDAGDDEHERDREAHRTTPPREFAGQRVHRLLRGRG
jgi:hypothetical protein